MSTDKIFMFPESFNKLRKELHDHHPDLWRKASWCLAYDAPMFVELMNKELGLRVQFNEELDNIYTTYLGALVKRRGRG